jgi:hypothetical protein
VNPVFAAAAEVEGVCRSHAWPFCFFGGLAVLRWGEPRLTRDVDVTVLARFGGEGPVVDALLASLAGRIDDARGFALRHRTLLMHAANGVPIDAALGGLPFEERMVSRASLFELEDGVTVTTCSAEDLIVCKAFAGRTGDWADIEGIAVRQSGALDRQLVTEELEPLLGAKGAPDDAERVRRLLA